LGSCSRQRSAARLIKDTAKDRDGPCPASMLIENKCALARISLRDKSGQMLEENGFAMYESKHSIAVEIPDLNVYKSLAYEAS
jgi:hypothetical protein